MIFISFFWILGHWAQCCDATTCTRTDTRTHNGCLVAFVPRGRFGISFSILFRLEYHTIKSDAANQTDGVDSSVRLCNVMITNKARTWRNSNKWTMQAHHSFQHIRIVSAVAAVPHFTGTKINFRHRARIKPTLFEQRLNCRTNFLIVAWNMERETSFNLIWSYQSNLLHTLYVRMAFCSRTKHRVRPIQNWKSSRFHLGSVLVLLLQTAVIVGYDICCEFMREAG